MLMVVVPTDGLVSSRSLSSATRTMTNKLARLGRVDPQSLYPIWHRSREVRQDLVVLRARDALVSVRTELINTHATQESVARMKPLQFGPIGSIFASGFSFIAKKVLRRHRSAACQTEFALPWLISK